MLSFQSMSDAQVPGRRQAAILRVPAPRPGLTTGAYVVRFREPGFELSEFSRRIARVAVFIDGHKRGKVRIKFSLKGASLGALFAMMQRRLK